MGHITSYIYIQRYTDCFNTQTNINYTHTIMPCIHTCNIYIVYMHTDFQII